MSSPYPLPSSTVILASASPRRRALLGDILDRPFEQAAADIDESRLPGERPEAHVCRLALEKALAIVAARSDAALVIGADTIVVFEGRILGKPESPAAARATLQGLRGRRHEVITGLAMVDSGSGRRLSTAATTGVWMRDYTDAEIETYVASGDPMDKAGAYAIQHTGFRPVARLEGAETNVIGLPLGLTRWMLEQMA